MRQFGCSEALVGMASEVIPLAAQTLSRSHIRFPQEYPKFLVSGRGCRVRDVDENEFIDFICGLGSITLGYRNERVDSQVVEWIRERGVGFSLPTRLEMGLADKLLELTPWADKVRFAKGGSDVMSAAVRLARAFNGKDLILVARGGYHGWHDWFACLMEGRDRGVAVGSRYGVRVFSDERKLSFYVNSVTHGVSAIVLEPGHFTKEQLLRFKDMIKGTDILLIFDEVVSGFRYALGGWHMTQGVVPDLVAFGKGMGNGYPVSALVGRGDIMGRLERDVFFSSTFGGDPIGLVAALATIWELERTNAIEGMRKNGSALEAALSSLIAEHDLKDAVKLDGHPQMLHVTINDMGARSVFLQEMARRGILIYNSNTLCASHGVPEIMALEEAYKEVFPLLRRAQYGDTSMLVGPVVQQAEVRR